MGQQLTSELKSTFNPKRFFNSKKLRTVLLVGLDNSGKSTLLSNLSPSLLSVARSMSEHGVTQASTSPTSGLSLVEFVHDRAKWRVWDMSGQGRFRPLWAYYVGHVQAIIFVVDITDTERIACSRDELSGILESQKVKEKRLPVLVFANKSDLGDKETEAEDGEGYGYGGKKSKALSVDNVQVGFGIDSLSEKHKVKVFASSGLTGTGVAEGFNWLNDVLGQGDFV